MIFPALDKQKQSVSVLCFSHRRIIRSRVLAAIVLQHNQHSRGKVPLDWR